jgi:hypothetical protein
MKEINLTANIIAGITAFVLVLIDHFNSKKDIYYGLTEGNKIWRDRNWYYNSTKGFITSYFVVLPMFIGLLFIPTVGQYSYLLFIPTIIGEYFVLQRKKKSHETMRKKQLSNLEILKRDDNGLLLGVTVRNNTARLTLFPHIEMPASVSDNLQELSFRLMQKLKEDLRNFNSSEEYLTYIEKEDVYRKTRSIQGATGSF